MDPEIQNSDVEQCQAALLKLQQQYKDRSLSSLVPLLPFLLKIRGKPYHLNNHFAMEPMFALPPSRRCVAKTARQVTKSTCVAAQSCILAALEPYLSILHVAPRYEQIRRFSNNYVKPFLTESPLGKLMLAHNDEQSVTQRTLKNKSIMHFSFAFLDAERLRGIGSDRCAIDEAQDIDTSFLPIILETLSASPYGFIQYTGTPKTFDNTLQLLWEDSSQAEWVTPCHACNHWNVATVEYDLLDMIQPDGVSCAKCHRLINPAEGHWEHRIPERRQDFSGYHVPQPIMPMHYAPDPETGERFKWKLLYAAKTSISKGAFYNEKLGESCDTHASLITRSDLVRASTLQWDNSFKEALRHAARYPYKIMGIDWGGGGAAGLSYTTIAILGFTPDGHIDMIYGERLSGADPTQEAAVALRYYKMFGCEIIAHDFGGAGSIRETLLVQGGFPANRLFPASYVATTAASLVTYREPSGLSTRCYYSVDKARSLMLLCQLVKSGHYRFPRYQSWEPLANDMLSLVEERRATNYGSDVYFITKKANKTDDFTHSVNLASLAYWHANQRYPQIAGMLQPQITAEQEQQLQGSGGGDTAGSEEN